MAVLGYGDRWRVYRRLLNPWLNKQAVVAFHASQEKEAYRLLQRLLNTYEGIHNSEDLENEFGL